MSGQRMKGALDNTRLRGPAASRYDSVAVGTNVPTSNSLLPLMFRSMRQAAVIHITRYTASRFDHILIPYILFIGSD